MFFSDEIWNDRKIISRGGIKKLHRPDAIAAKAEITTLGSVLPPPMNDTDKTHYVTHIPLHCNLLTGSGYPG